MRRVLVVNTYNFQNMGEVLQLEALTKILQGDTLSLASWYSYVDRTICEDLGISVAGATRPPDKVTLLLQAASSLARLALWRQAGVPAPAGILKAYDDCDFVVDLGGDTFSDSPSPVYTLAHCFALIPALMLGKPYTICSQSIGPFKTPITRALAHYVLSHAQSITARDPITYSYLKEDLAVAEDKIELCRDLAFFTPRAASPEDGLIGLNPSPLAHRYMGLRPKEYIDFVADLVSRLQESHRVVLIPHVYGPRHGLGKVANQDDRQVIEEVAARVDVETGTHNDIGRCSAFIGFRMHACINAMSRGIPTLALSYSQKSSGLPRAGWVKTLDIREGTASELVTRIVAETDGLTRLQSSPADILGIRGETYAHSRALQEIRALANTNLLGQHHRCAVGYAASAGTRLRGASGGVTSALVKCALESGSVDSAVLVDQTTVPPQPVIVSEASQIAQCAGSAYSIPGDTLTNMAKLVPQGQDCVVVGLPCQVSTLKSRFPNCTCVGLFCSHRIKESGVRFLLDHFKVAEGPVQFRAKKDGDTGLLHPSGLFIPLKMYWNRFLNYCFIPRGCTHCHDLTAEDADISVGDAWGLSETAELGLNAIICRTRRGEELLSMAVERGDIRIREVSPAEIVRTQRNYLLLKKGRLNLKLRVYMLLRVVGMEASQHRALYPLLHGWLTLAVRGKWLQRQGRTEARHARATLRPVDARSRQH